MSIKSHILKELDGVREKSFFGELVLGHPHCSSSNSTEFNDEHENKCPFSSHTGSSILTFREIYLHVIVQKKFFSIIFLHEIHHICISNI